MHSNYDINFIPTFGIKLKLLGLEYAGFQIITTLAHLVLKILDLDYNIIYIVL
jgi:hypothetical protein